MTTKLPIPEGQLGLVLDKFGNLEHEGTFYFHEKRDVYWRVKQNKPTLRNISEIKVLRLRRDIIYDTYHILKADKVFTGQAIGALEENDIKTFVLENIGDPESDKTKLAAKIISVNDGYENDLEKEIHFSSNQTDTAFELLKVLGYKVKSKKYKFSIFHEMKAEPFNVEIVYRSGLDEHAKPTKDGAWYVEVETTPALQEKQGTSDWKKDEYESRICRIFQTLGLDPVTLNQTGDKKNDHC